MHSTPVKPAQLLMGFLAEEQAKIGQRISSEDFARDLEEERQATRTDESSLRLLDIPGRPSVSADTFREHPSPANACVMRTALKAKSSPRERAENRTHAQRHATALSKAKWKIAPKLSFTDPAALDNVLAQLQLPTEARQSCQSARDDERRISLKDLNTILDRATQDVKKEQSQERVSAHDVQTLLASLHQDRKCISESLSHLKIRRKGAYDLDELRRILRRVETEAADQTLNNGSPELSTNPSLADPVATAEIDLASGNGTGKIASQVERLAEGPIPSFLKDKELGEIRATGPPSTLTPLLTEAQKSMVRNPEALDSPNPSSLSPGPDISNGNTLTVVQGKGGSTGGEPPIGMTESNASAGYTSQDVYPAKLPSSANDEQLSQLSTVFAETAAVPGEETSGNKSHAPSAVELIRGVTPTGNSEATTGGTIQLSLADLLAEAESSSQTVVKSHHFETDSAGSENVGDTGRAPLSQTGAGNNPVPHAGTAWDGGSQPHKDHGSNAATGAGPQIGSPLEGFGTALSRESGKSFSESPKQPDDSQNPTTSVSGGKPGERISPAQSDSSEGLVRPADVEKLSSPLLTNTCDQDNAPGLNREGVCIMPSGVSSPTVKNVQTLTLTASSWPAELAERIKELRGQQQRHLTLELEPLHLGRLLLRVETNQNRVTTSIFAQSEEARMLLNGGMSQLRQQLEANGLTLSHFSVNVNQGRFDSPLSQRRFHLATRERNGGTQGSQKRRSEAVGGSELNVADRIVSLFA